jgi:hypothetical protein
MREWNLKQKLEKSPISMLRQQSKMISTDFIRCMKQLVNYKRNLRISKNDSIKIQLRQVKTYLSRLEELKSIEIP